MTQRIETQSAYQHGVYPDARGRYGEFGGRFVPESLMAALDELEGAYAAARADVSFTALLAQQERTYTGRPTPLYLAERLSRRGGARVYLKREDLAHTGAHKINNALGQGLLAARMGKRRIIAETGAGQHGVATATVCAKLGLECVVYMGERTCAARRSTSSACDCSARRCARSPLAAHASRMRSTRRSATG
jgi:tryptophan synthase beta chain